MCAAQYGAVPQLRRLPVRRMCARDYGAMRQLRWHAVGAAIVRAPESMVYSIDEAYNGLKSYVVAMHVAMQFADRL